MTKITFLGTAYAVPSKDQQNTHFVIESGDRVILVDCSGNPVTRFGQAGIDPTAITDLFLTHFHPDHVSAVPLLLMDLWLMGRKEPLAIVGLEDTIDRVEQMMALFIWQDWAPFYPVNFHRLPSKEQDFSLGDSNIHVWTAPTCHIIPSIGIKWQFEDGTLCYSSDTAPCDAVVELAMGVDVLIHEATGESSGHTSAVQAGEIAQKAGAKRLYLVHYPGDIEPDELKAMAESAYTGDVFIAEDLMTVSLPSAPFN